MRRTDRRDRPGRGAGHHRKSLRGGAMKQTHWLSRCVVSGGKNPYPLPMLANAMIALREDLTVRDTLAFDEMLRAPLLLHEVGVPIGGNVEEPRPLSDKDVTTFQEWMQKAGLKGI